MKPHPPEIVWEGHVAPMKLIRRHGEYGEGFAGEMTSESLSGGSPAKLPAENSSTSSEKLPVARFIVNEARASSLCFRCSIVLASVPYGRVLVV